MQPLISRAAVNAFMARPMDDFQWVKRLTRRELMSELAQLPVKPAFKTDPWFHQLVCFFIGVCMPDFLFLLDMGLGKSKITLDIFHQRLRMGEALRMLVLVPRLINHESWENAVLDHTILEPTCCSMREVEGKYETLQRPHGQVTIIDYHGFALAMCTKARGKGNKTKLVPDPRKIAALQKVYQMVVLDEIHKITKSSTMWFELLSKLLVGIPYRYGATGTLFNRDVAGLWAPFRLIDGGETFGETDALFRAGFFEAEAGGFATSYKFNRSMIMPLNRMIGHRSIRYADREVLDLPSLVVHPPVRFHMSEETRTHYLRAVQGVINAGTREAKKAAYVTMRHVTAGHLTWKDEYGEHQHVFEEQPKLQYLEAMLDRLQGQKLLVSHEYTATGGLIVSHLQRLGIRHCWLHGGIRDPIGVKRQFCEDPGTQVMVMNSAAGAEGTDGLQKVCQHLLMYETPSGPTGRQQVIKRLHRPGQQKRVYVTDMVMSGTVDVRLIENVNESRDFFLQVMEGRVGDGSFFG